MTEIRRIDENLSQYNQTNRINLIKADNNGVPEDAIILNNQIVPPVGVENPFTQNPFYQQQLFLSNPTYLNTTNPIENKWDNLWKYLAVGGLGLFTGLILGSMMPYSYYFYYPMYYSYFYSPLLYNFGWYW